MGKLFGTDGIRGKANEYPMISEMAINLGRAIVRVFGTDKPFVIGKDTRLSGDMLECALASGICSAGGNVQLLGVIPTPGVAFAARWFKAAAGMVISASHNPYYDNGIKVFNQDGFKLSDEQESEIESLLQHPEHRPIRDTGIVKSDGQARKAYSNFLKQTVACRMDGMKIVTDCSNGAAAVIAPPLFSELGAQTESLFDQPDGKNINLNCGSQHPETLTKRVLETRANIGLAFDGDADRLIAVDEMGGIVTGDRILAICANSLKQKGLLTNNTVVSTVMSNIGLKIAFKEMGIRHIMADVGDRYVMEEMLKAGAVLGGEDSGHTIFLNHHTTGDGILTALQLIQIMRETVKPLSELGKMMAVYPQKLVNIEVNRKPPLESVPEIDAAIKNVENRLGDNGRVLVRYSGTQPMCRVMVEAQTIDETEQYCRLIAEVVKEKLRS